MRKSKVRKMWYKIYPKLIVTIAGCGVYYGALYLPADLKSLMISVSAALITIPILIIVYEIWEERSHQRFG